MTIGDICNEINHTYPHLTRGLGQTEAALVLGAYFKPFLKVPKVFWQDILDDFHRRSMFVRPANVYAAIDEVIGEAKYDVPRPRWLRTQLDAFQEMKINEKRKADWEEGRRAWVKKWLSESSPANTALHEHGSGERVPTSDATRSGATVVALRPVQ